MVSFFQKHSDMATIYEMLGEGESGEIGRKTITEVLVDALGREPEISEVNAAQEELRKEEGRVKP
jgi:hypothetical protein